MPKTGYAQCFWCGEKIDVEVIYPDDYEGEVPERAVVSYEPCPECQKGIDLGVWFIEATQKPNMEGQPPFRTEPDEVYPTGRCVVLVEAEMRKIVGPGPELEALLKARKTFMPPDVFEKLFGDKMKKQS